MSDLKSARIDLERKVRKDPEDIDARLSLAKIQMEDKDPPRPSPSTQRY